MIKDRTIINRYGDYILPTNSRLLQTVDSIGAASVDYKVKLNRFYYPWQNSLFVLISIRNGADG